MMFLVGLKDAFSQVRGQILTMDQIPPISKVFSLVLQDEKHREIGAPAPLPTETLVAFAIKAHRADHGSVRPMLSYRASTQRYLFRPP